MRITALLFDVLDAVAFLANHPPVCRGVCAWVRARMSKTVDTSFPPPLPILESPDFVRRDGEALRNALGDLLLLLLLLLRRHPFVSPSLVSPHRPSPSSRRALLCCVSSGLVGLRAGAKAVMGEDESVLWWWCARGPTAPPHTTLPPSPKSPRPGRAPTRPRGRPPPPAAGGTHARPPPPRRGGNTPRVCRAR